MTDTIRKIRIAFYGHLQRMKSDRCTGRIFKYIRKLKMVNTWISEMENDIEELHITHEDITERTPLRIRLNNFKGFQEKLRKKKLFLCLTVNYVCFNCFFPSFFFSLHISLILSCVFLSFPQSKQLLFFYSVFLRNL